MLQYQPSGLIHDGQQKTALGWTMTISSVTTVFSTIAISSVAITSNLCILETRDFVDGHFAVRQGNINSTSFCSFFLCHCLTLALRERINEIFRSKGLHFGEIHLHQLNLQKPSAEPSFSIFSSTEKHENFFPTEKYTRQNLHL